MDNYGSKLKRLRLIKGKNKEEIAEVIDRTKRSVYNYETGKGQISLENAMKLCKDCGEDISYLQDNEIINADVIAVYTNEYGRSKYFSGTTYFMANVISDYENKKVLCIDVGLNGGYEIDRLFGIYEGNHEQGRNMMEGSSFKESKLNRKTMNVFDINIPLYQSNNIDLIKNKDLCNVFWKNQIKGNEKLTLSKVLSEMEKSGGYDVIFLYGTNCSSLNQVSYRRDNLKDYLQLADVIIIPLIDCYSFDQAEYAINHIEKYNKEASVNLITIVDGEVEFSNYEEFKTRFNENSVYDESIILNEFDDYEEGKRILLERRENFLKTIKDKKVNIKLVNQDIFIDRIDWNLEGANYYELDELEMTKNHFLMAWNQCIKSKI